MHSRPCIVGIALVLALVATTSARAALVSTHVTASSSVTQVQSGVNSTDSATKSTTADSLPLQPVARIIDPNSHGAAISASQYLEPTTDSTANPQEFALDLALNTLSTDLRYSGQAVVDETRVARFTPAELGGSAGQTVRIRGKLYLDGALAIFAGTDTADLTGTHVTLHVTITAQSASLAARTVFDGTLTANGGANRAVTIAVDGQMPTAGIYNTNLSLIDPHLGVFRAFVFPSLQIEYPVSVVLDEDTTLQLHVELNGTTISGSVGVAALIGTPLSSLQNVITATTGSATAKTMDTALKNEIAAPTGEEAFPTNPWTTLFPGCGLFGFESLLGFVGLVGLRAMPGIRRARRTANIATPRPNSNREQS